MNTTTQQITNSLDLKKQLGALMGESPLGPHAMKTVEKIKLKLQELGINNTEIENIMYP